MAIKYRPYLTSSELSEIIRCVKTSSHNKVLISYLESFSLKINHGVISPQISTLPTVAESLGLDSPSSSSNEFLVSEPRSKLGCFLRWKIQPHLLSPDELSKAHLYRYENDLMTPEEETEYEANNS
jgi:hypothetical protein